MRFKTTIELDVEVVGHYTGETLARGMMGPPEDSEPGEAEDFEIEAVLVPGSATSGGRQDTLSQQKRVNILDALSDAERADLVLAGCEQAREQMEDAYLEQQIAREEARRDAKEDR
jgi:hypothetical protein